MSNNNSIIYTRFPPEPNGYIHLGHLKAMMFDFEKYNNCKCFLRLDDTNPESETQEFVDNIIEDTEWLNFNIYKITYTSDYFDILLEYAIALIKNEKAYVDFSSIDQIKSMRKEKIESEYRNKPIEWHLEEFENMRSGKYKENQVVLRLKIDMQNVNGTLRDPIAYRIKYTPHYKTLTKYCIYPSYDYSHGIVDALENITYSYCTMEFYTRRDQYYWPIIELNKLGYNLKPAQVQEFGKLVVENNILSKRNIIKLIKSGEIIGFDDPRLLTIKGLRKRGFTADILRKIINENTSMERNDTLLTEDIIKHYLRTELDKISYRMFAVIDPLSVSIMDQNFERICEHSNHPLNKNFYSHNTILDKNIYIEKSDFKEVDDKNYYRIAPGKIVRLKYADFIKYESHDDNILVVKNIIPENPKKIKGIIHWVSEKDSIECEFEIYDTLLKNNEFNKDSKIIKYGRLEKSALEYLDKILQFERVGFFRFDRFENNKPIFIRIIDLVDKFNK